MEKILLAVDGSAKSTKAAKKAGEIAKALGAQITVINVVTINNNYKSAYSKSKIKRLMEERKQEIKKGKKILSETVALLKEKGIEINNKVLRKGDPSKWICEEAKKGKFDLVILADKGESKIKRFSLGNTSDKVVRYMSTSVLIVK